MTVRILTVEHRAQSKLTLASNRYIVLFIPSHLTRGGSRSSLVAGRDAVDAAASDRRRSVRAQARSEAHSLYKGCARTPVKREAQTIG